MRGMQTSSRSNRYTNTGNGKREDPPKDKKPTTTAKPGSSLPTPEPEIKNLPDIESSHSPADMNTPPNQSTRAGKAPERLQIPDITPTKDMELIGLILHEMKQNVAKMENALKGIENQARALTALHGPLKLQEELQMVQQALHNQIKSQKEEIKHQRDELQGLLLRQLDEQIKQKINLQIHEIVEQAVSNRMREELNKLIPEDIKDQSVKHRERTWNIKSRLINSEARRKNANAEKMERLHKLVISDLTVISRSSSSTTAYTPLTAGVPPTPLDTNSLELSVPDDNICVSLAFPNNLQDLHDWYGNKKDRGKICQLLEHYEGDNLMDLTDDLEAANAVDRLFHSFGVLDPRHHVALPPVKEGQPLSPLIITAD